MEAEASAAIAEEKLKYYISKYVRQGSKVTSKVLEYLGADPEEKRLKRALTYWRVKGGER